MNYQRRAWLNAITENTGTHILDSGGALGRHWQRNKGLTLDTAYSWTHRLEVDSYGFTVTINVLHYLESNFTIDRKATSRFHRWANTGKMAREDWWTCLQAWVEHIGGEYGNGDNTYNHDNWLSQEVLMRGFTDRGGDAWWAIQTHNGADVRGGYSKPFLCRQDECEWEVWMVDGWMGCENGHLLYADGACHWICDDPHRSLSDDDLKPRTNGRGWWLPCPVCGKKLSM
jgi:hypothetical protein